PQIKEKLKSTATQLEGFKKLAFYTDGSLLSPTENPERRKMGIGWVAA
ncbi:14849_t:CDS:1, partial [Dentiscutata heterogama]